MANQDDGLFLLEVLIDKIIYTKIPCFGEKNFRTCVSIHCPSCEPLEICDDDPDGTRSTTNVSSFVKSFNSGKSCLFSMKKADIANAMSSFPVKVSVYKELPCGCLPAKIHLGDATIDMTKEFMQARSNFLEDPNSVSYEALKDSFRLLGPDGTESGDILMFLRISCFGKLIITKFQGGGAPSLAGAGSGSVNIDRSCNSPKGFQTRDDPCACGASRGGAGGARSPGAGGASAGSTGGACHRYPDPYNSKPCEEVEDPCCCTGPKPPHNQPMACRNTEQYCLHVPKGQNKRFEEIGTNLGGNELKIKVPASASVIKKISQTHCAMQSPYVPKRENDKDATKPCHPPCGKNQISLALPSEDVCCQGAELAETQFTYTTEGCPMASKHSQPPPPPPPGDLTENRDVFVLKVAKTAMQGDKKCRLEVELVTPKKADKTLPIEKRDQRMQSDLDCECCVRRIRKPRKCHRLPPCAKA